MGVRWRLHQRAVRGKLILATTARTTGRWRTQRLLDDESIGGIDIIIGGKTARAISSLAVRRVAKSRAGTWWPVYLGGDMGKVYPRRCDSVACGTTCCQESAAPIHPAD